MKIQEESLLQNSRHRSQVIYNSFVEYNLNNKTYNSITGWFCSCKIGSRIVGCYTHIIADIYYLSIGRYLSQKSLIYYKKYIFNSKENVSNNIVTVDSRFYECYFTKSRRYE